LEEQNLPKTSSTESDETVLTKLAFSLITVFLAYWLFSGVGNAYLARHLSDRGPGSLDRDLRSAELASLATAVFVWLEMMFVLWIFRPVNKLLRSPLRPSGSQSVLQDVLLGAAGGIAGFVVAIPILLGTRATLLVSSSFSPSHSIELRGVAIILFFCLFLPIAEELVFRVVTQQKLAVHMSPLAAILVSAVLSASLWSLFNFVFAMILGLICSSLYWWRKSVLPAIVAHVAMTVSAGTYVAVRMLSRG